MVSLPVLPLCDPRAPQTLFHHLVPTRGLVMTEEKVILSSQSHRCFRRLSLFMVHIGWQCPRWCRLGLGC